MFLTIKLLQFTLLTGYLINQLNDCVMDVGWYSKNAIMDSAFMTPDIIKHIKLTTIRPSWSHVM